MSDPTAKQLCVAIAADQSANLCSVAKQDYCRVSTGTAPPTTATSPCTALTTCCDTLDDDDDQEECAEVADAAVVADCAASLTELCPDATTPTTPTTSTPSAGACAELTTCCGTLEDDEDIEACEATVSDGDAIACADSNAELCGTEAEGDD